MARKWWTLTAVVAGMFMLLDVTIVNVALPQIQKAFSASLPDLQCKMTSGSPRWAPGCASCS